MKNKQHRQLAVCGFEAVRALATKNPQKIERLFFTEDRARFFGPVCKELASKKKVYRVVEDSKELERLSESVHHQGVVAMIQEPTIPILDFQTLMQFAREGVHFLALDRVGNAQNLGAIIRSAAFFGIQHIVISGEDEQASVSTATYRVAQGGMEFVHVWKVRSIAWLMDACKDQILRIGADHRAKINVTEGMQKVGAKKSCVIVMGNEETGLSKDVTSSCDFLVKIPGSGNIESLNVAQAATVFLYELAR